MMTVALDGLTLEAVTELVDKNQSNNLKQGDKTSHLVHKKYSQFLKERSWKLGLPRNNIFYFVRNDQADGRVGGFLILLTLLPQPLIPFIHLIALYILPAALKWEGSC